MDKKTLFFFVSQYFGPNSISSVEVEGAQKYFSGLQRIRMVYSLKIHMSKSIIWKHWFSVLVLHSVLSALTVNFHPDNPNKAYSLVDWLNQVCWKQQDINVSNQGGCRTSDKNH